MKLYQLSKSEAISKGFTEKQWKNSIKGKNSWDKRSEGSKFRQINSLLRGRDLPEFQKVYEFKVYGYEDTTEGTASKLEGVFTYRGDKVESELESLKDDLWEKVQRSVGKKGRGKKPYKISKVSMGFSESSFTRTRMTGETLKGDFVSLGIGNATGKVLNKSLNNFL